jgi:hypothetical protein
MSAIMQHVDFIGLEKGGERPRLFLKFFPIFHLKNVESLLTMKVF